MKDKSTKQQWPRSAKVTVWVLGIVLVLSLVWQLSFVGVMDSMYKRLRYFKLKIAPLNQILPNTRKRFHIQIL